MLLLIINEISCSKIQNNNQKFLRSQGILR